MNSTALTLARRLFDRRLIQNQFRSLFVEAMIEPVIEPGGWIYVGDNWNGWDFENRTESSTFRLEVKQSAKRQTWTSSRPRSSRAVFDIAERSGYFANGAASWTPSRGRSADIYLFCWHPIDDVDLVDHRSPDQWLFFPVANRRLPKGQKTIGLSGVRDLSRSCGFDEAVDIRRLASGLEKLLLRVAESITDPAPPASSGAGRSGG